MSQLYFFRHAQASYGAKNYDLLSPKGEEQATILGEYLVKKKQHFDKVYVGPLKRQQQTYELVKAVFEQQNLPFPNAILLDNLREHEGTEGVKKAIPKLIATVPQIKQWYAEIEANPALKKRNTLLAFDYFMNNWVDGKIELSNIQSWADFRQMVRAGLHKICEQTGKGEKIAVFTSGGTIASITAESLKISDEKRVAAMNFSIRNTSFSTFFYSKRKFNLLSFNELPHLEGEMVTFV